MPTLATVVIAERSGYCLTHCKVRRGQFPQWVRIVRKGSRCAIGALLRLCCAVELSLKWRIGFGGTDPGVGGETRPN